MHAMATRDTRTRYQGVYARHQERCALSTRTGDRCTCKPSYWGKAYDRARSRPVRTRRFATAEAARNARADSQASLDRGEAPAPARGLHLADARQRFVAAAREGRALNKHGRRYKPCAIDNIDEVLRVHVEPRLGRRRITDVRRGDVQVIVDMLGPELSGSRVRAVVNSLRALYRWAQDRDLAQHDPAQHVRLPAMAAQPVERVASPAEFAALLEALPLEDACHTRWLATAWADASRSCCCAGGRLTSPWAPSSGAWSGRRPSTRHHAGSRHASHRCTRCSGVRS